MALFVERGADINELTRTGGGLGCLHILAGSKHTTVEHVRFLLDKGADARLLTVRPPHSNFLSPCWLLLRNSRVA
jgi:hypothetical protein